MKSTQSVTVSAAIDAATRALSGTSSTPRLDAEVLLHHACGVTRTDAAAQPLRPLPEAIHAAFTALIERRQQGEPIAYITGRREFWSLDLAVSPATLIPRPETELLVEQALARIRLEEPSRIADLGTGCGAIALAIAHERPQARVLAIDSSDAALEIARANAESLGVASIEFHLGEWFAPVENQRFDIVVSNPPYLRADDPHLRVGDLRFEPRAALVAGTEGLEAIRAIAHAALAHLAAGGWLLLEHGADQGSAVQAFLTSADFGAIETHADLAGRPRVTLGQQPCAN